jgi:hypothetical protein
MTKIYDCFTFYNELDLLELRLREHYDHVDQFVIAEANMSFTGKPKPYYLDENWDRFEQWADKITYIQIEDLNPTGDPWANEAHSRECLKQGLVDAQPKDIIMLSDCDEIFRPTTWQRLRGSPDKRQWGVRMPCFYFKLNYMQTHPTLWWAGGSAIRFEFLGKMEDLRKARNEIGIREMSVILHAGWHFGWLGDNQAAITKLESFAHQELNTPEVVGRLDLEQSIKNGHGINPNDSGDQHYVVEVDDYFPASILVNKDRWAKYISPNATNKVTDFLKFGR